jgi:hypothetical protein
LGGRGVWNVALGLLLIQPVWLGSTRNLHCPSQRAKAQKRKAGETLTRPALTTEARRDLPWSRIVGKFVETFGHVIVLTTQLLSLTFTFAQGC